MELFPAVDILDGHVVRLKQGDYARVTVYEKDPVRMAALFEEQGATWLHVVDLEGARSGAPCIVDTVSSIIERTGLRVEVGGGIRTMDSLSVYADLGVARIVMGTALIADPVFARQAAERYPGRIVAGVDARAGEVAVEGWLEGAGVSVDKVVEGLSRIGIDDLVYTDIARDGMQTGIDADAYARLARSSGARVVASGGISTLSDLAALRETGCVWGAIVGRALYEGDFTLSEALTACEGDAVC